MAQPSATLQLVAVALPLPKIVVASTLYFYIYGLNMLLYWLYVMTWTVRGCVRGGLRLLNKDVEQETKKFAIPQEYLVKSLLKCIETTFTHSLSQHIKKGIKQ
jgi:hypothetical protein